MLAPWRRLRRNGNRVHPRAARAALEAEQPFATDLALLAPLAKDDPKIAEQSQVLRPLADKGVASRAGLAADFPAMAKAALADPSQAEVPVITIAMDAGFQSLGPFNRAFKATTGVTPTEYRKLNEAGAQVL